MHRTHCFVWTLPSHGSLSFPVACTLRPQARTPATERAATSSCARPAMDELAERDAALKENINLKDRLRAMEKEAAEAAEAAEALRKEATEAAEALRTKDIAMDALLARIRFLEDSAAAIAAATVEAALPHQCPQHEGGGEAQPNTATSTTAEADSAYQQIHDGAHKATRTEPASGVLSNCGDSLSDSGDSLSDCGDNMSDCGDSADKSNSDDPYAAGAAILFTAAETATAVSFEELMSKATRRHPRGELATEKTSTCSLDVAYDSGVRRLMVAQGGDSSNFYKRCSGSLDNSHNQQHLLDRTHASDDFQAESLRIGKVIVSEINLPNERKTIKPVAAGGLAGGQKYIVNGIIFKVPEATDLYGGSVVSANKAAGHDLRCLGQFARAVDRIGDAAAVSICTPMQCLIDYQGTRLCATALLPFIPVNEGRDATLRLGTPGKNKSDAQMWSSQQDQVLIDLTKTLGQSLNLAEHLVL